MEVLLTIKEHQQRDKRHFIRTWWRPGVLAPTVHGIGGCGVVRRHSRQMLQSTHHFCHHILMPSCSQVPLKLGTKKLTGTAKCIDFFARGPVFGRQSHQNLNQRIITLRADVAGRTARSREAWTLTRTPAGALSCGREV
jgi:hypothetical protein